MSDSKDDPRPAVAVVGAGPAGLMAADRLAARGATVTVYEAMPTAGRKFLLAGRSGLNLTHAEPFETFAGRYGPESRHLRAALDAFPPRRSGLRRCARRRDLRGLLRPRLPQGLEGLAPAPRWLRRLDAAGVRILTRHRWTGFGPMAASFDTPGRAVDRPPRRDGPRPRWRELATPRIRRRMGSDPGRGRRPAHALRPANCGFDVAWSDAFAGGNAGEPVKSVVATVGDEARLGEFVITRHGVEGGSSTPTPVRSGRRWRPAGRRVLRLDLAPGRDRDRLAAAFALQDRKASFATRVRKAAGLEGVKAGLLRGDPAGRRPLRNRRPRRSREGPPPRIRRAAADRRGDLDGRRRRLRGAGRDLRLGGHPRRPRRRGDDRMGGPTGGYLSPPVSPPALGRPTRSPTASACLSSRRRRRARSA